MTEEIQKPAPEGQAAPEEQPKDEQPESPEGKPEVDDGSKQLEAQLQKEREAREKAERILAEKSFKERQKAREEEESSGEDKPLTEAQLEARLAKERELIRKESQSSEISRIAGNLSNNDTERQLIIEIHKNRSFPSHLSLEEQLKEAKLLANKDRIFAENEELKRAVLGNKNANTDASQIQQDFPKSSEPKLAQLEKAELARQGWKWNGSSKRFEKKLPKGTLVRNQDGSTQFIEG